MRYVTMMLGLTACGLRGSGVPAEEVRQVAPFEGVAHHSSFPVDVVTGQTTEVFVTCDDNLIDLIRTEVRDGTLAIDTEPNYILRPQADCGVLVTVPSVRELAATGSGPLVARGVAPAVLRVTGSGELVVRGVASGELSLTSTGSGTLDVSGEAAYADVTATGSGGVAARGLVVARADVQVSGSGDVTLTVTGQADVHTSGSGDVEVWGGGQVDGSSSGSGDVVRH